MSPFIVEWAPLLPFEQVDWADTAVDGIEALTASWEIRFRQPTDTHANLLILAYMTVDHIRIDSGEILKSRLDYLSPPSSTQILMLACGKSRPTVAWADVKEVAMKQSLPRTNQLTILRSLTTAELGEKFVVQVTQLLKLGGASSRNSAPPNNQLPILAEPQSLTIRPVDEI